MPWPDNAIIYHLLIDRFANDVKEIPSQTSSSWIGGNLKGILKKLLYLKDLGINTIWISPFCKASSYHGYDAEDYYQVDPHFGTKQDLKELIDACHNLDIKVIADFVPNHCSEMHPFFMDAAKNRDSRYAKWFIFRKWPKSYLCFLDVKHLPKLNLENIETRRYIIDAAKYWVSEFGLDGYRLDHAIGPNIDFWNEFVSEIKKVDNDFVFLGEVWFFGIAKKHMPTLGLDKKELIAMLGKRKQKLGIEDWAMAKFEDCLTGCLDFTFNALIREYVIESKISEIEFKKKIDKHYSLFKNSFLLPTFLDNHDMDRFLFQAKGDVSKVKRAAEIQFSLKNPPIIYYGTEVGLHQNGSAIGNDIQARFFIEWDSKKQDYELHSFYKRLISERNIQ